jgi:hypothetical protein
MPAFWRPVPERDEQRQNTTLDPGKIGGVVALAVP